MFGRDQGENMRRGLGPVGQRGETAVGTGKTWHFLDRYPPLTPVCMGSRGPQTGTLKPHPCLDRLPPLSPQLPERPPLAIPSTVCSSRPSAEECYLRLRSQAGAPLSPSVSSPAALWPQFLHLQNEEVPSICKLYQ